MQFVSFSRHVLQTISASPRYRWLRLVCAIMVVMSLFGSMVPTPVLYAQSGVTDPGGYFIMVPFLVYIAGGFLLSAAALFRFSDIRRWFPAKTT